MPKETRGWPPKRRQKQAERIQKTRPWQQSTGPKTDLGKTISRQNAFKHGAFAADMAHLLRVLSAQSQYVKAVLARQKP